MKNADTTGVLMLWNFIIWKNQIKTLVSQKKVMQGPGNEWKKNWKNVSCFVPTVIENFIPKVAAPDGNIRMKNRVNSGKPKSADAEMVILSQACSHRSS